MTSQARTIGKLFDTNAVIELLEKRTDINKVLADNPAIYVASISIGELRFGAYKSNMVTRNLARIKVFIGDKVILSCDLATADYYAQIRNQLRLKGRPIPQNDAWIAALAMQHDLILVTRDQHFVPIDGLLLESW